MPGGGWCVVGEEEEGCLSALEEHRPVLCCLVLPIPDVGRVDGDLPVLLLQGPRGAQPDNNGAKTREGTDRDGKSALGLGVAVGTDKHHRVTNRLLRTSTCNRNETHSVGRVRRT